MARQASDDRSPMVIAMEWSARLTTIGLEMALPPAGGYWLDGRIGTLPLFVVVGGILGLVVGMFHLMQIARQNGAQTPR